MTLSDKLRELMARGDAAAAVKDALPKITHIAECAALIRDHGPELLRALEDAERIRWPKSRDVARMGDMTPPGRSYLRVILDCDNDVCVEVWDQESGQYGSRAGVEFCTYVGGGRSQRTREALIALMVAMEADNAETPAKEWPPKDRAAIDQARQS